MISKLTALLEKKANIPIRPGDRVLYLGASHGVTPKIVSDIVGNGGFVFCLEVSKTVMRDLLKVCEARKNMAPLLFDAKKPEEYEKYVTEVDVIYQDIAQRDQVQIMKRNIRMFLKKGGFFIMMLKSGSVDVVRPPEEVLEGVKNGLSEYNILDIVNISKTHKCHYALIGKN